MEELSYEFIREGLSDATPAMEILSGVLRDVGRAAVFEIAAFLGMHGVDPVTMPSEYFLQAMIVEAEKVFAPVRDEETWTKLFVIYRQVTRMLAEHPELKEVREEALRKAAESAETELAAEKYEAKDDLDDDIIVQLFGKPGE